MVNKKYRKVIEDLDWKINEPIYDGHIELSHETVAGEDFSIYIDVNNIVNDINDYVFDAEEHIYMLLQAKRSGNNKYNIPDVFTLCEYAKEIENIIGALKIAINVINNKIYG